MRRVSLLIVLGFIALIAHSQNQLLNIVNIQSGKTIKVNLGDRMTIQYRGYMGQLNFLKEEVTGADDSCLYLGRSYEDVSEKLNKQLQKNGLCYQYKIRYSDIVQFRRESLGRVLLKSSVIGLPLAFGSYLLISQYLKQNQGANSIEQFLVVTTIGIGTLVLPKLFLPENLKYKIDNDWSFVLMNKLIP
ncbi:MAG: hypothetical protein NTU43_00450 [Bacteroidetes bacterium]|nr:hypothetical protein [Bacteroidota bacterium]